VTDTAFALRHPGYEIDVAGVWNTSTAKAQVVQWVMATRATLQPLAYGVYVNQLGDTSDQLVALAKGELCSLGGDQENVRPKQRAANQPKHQAR
jgi:hypothetical protein